MEGDRVGLDKNSGAHLTYDPNTLLLTNKASQSELDNSVLYVNRNTGYFYFGFDELSMGLSVNDKYALEKDRWENPKGIEKLFITPDGWEKKIIDGYEKCALRYETEVKEHSPGLI